MQALLQMIPREIDPLRRNKDGMTALHIAASQGHVEIVKEFVNSLRDEMKELDTADKIGMTPLFYGTYGFSLFSSN
jgi:ankyrin repeat protein